MESREVREKDDQATILVVDDNKESYILSASF